MADFDAKRDDLAAVNAKVVGGSVDTPEDAAKTIKRHGITFPVACEMDPAAFAAATGAFIDADRGIIHATGFILRPDATVGAALYSTGPIGRHTPDEVIGMIEYWSKQ